MHKLLTLFATLLLPSIAVAQGWIIPRPCPARPCVPDMPCIRCERPISLVERRSSEVRADLVDGVLRYEVTETFINRGAAVGEADYLFPLPKNAAFQDLRLSINGELVSGEALNAGEARRVYEEIVRRQRDPALVEWMGHGLLRTRIFPIAPGEEKKVVVRFQSVAEREGDALRVDYFRGGRRQSDGDGNGDSHVKSTFVLTYPLSSTYGAPYSPTHAVASRTSGGRRTITVNGEGGEVTVLIPVRRATEAAISALTYAPSRDDGFALITLSPPITRRQVTPRDVTLVLDVSGSMSGKKIVQARAAALQVLETLSPSDRFRIIDFSTDVRTFRDELSTASSANVAAASRYIESLDATGSTNISGALDEALRPAETPGRLGLVLFVTDGEPTVGERNPETIASEAARHRGNRRIFSFGIGAELNAALIERLAMEGRGTAHFVRPDESIERAVSVVASRLTNPVVTDLRVRADGVRLVKMQPADGADLFAGQDLVILTRYRGDGATTLRFEGRTPSGPVVWTSHVVFPASSRENSFIARLWATGRVGYLSAERARNGRSSEIDNEIRELGERYGIPTEFSSYLVLEPGMRRDRIIGGGNPQLNSMVTTGAAAAPATVARTESFERAKTSAAQREAKTLADTGVDLSEQTGLRRAGDRLFSLSNGTWSDTQIKNDSGTRTIKVKAYSSAYFRLIDALPALKEPFALGDHVRVAGRRVIIEVSDTGMETLSDRELESIRVDW
ncbi:MAG TPA: VIT domain-containing protein [Gemmatimonadaceae bacterium]